MSQTIKAAKGRILQPRRASLFNTAYTYAFNSKVNMARGKWATKRAGARMVSKSQ